MKLTIPRLFDAARLLSTKTGQELQELINYSQNAFDQLIRAVRNQLTFEDNFNCQVITVTLRHDREQALSITSSVLGIIPTRISSPNGLDQLDKFGYYINSNNQLTVKAAFASANPNQDITVTLIVLLA